MSLCGLNSPISSSPTGKPTNIFSSPTSSLALTATLAGGASVAVPVQRNAGGIPAFTADLTPQLIPAKLDSLQMTYKVEHTFDGKSFTLLQIKQVFIASAVDPNAVATATYALTPGSWEDAVQRKRVSNSAIHPLIEFSLTTSGKITLKVAMLDLSDAWAHLHRENDRYKRHALRSAGTGLAFKVFAYVGGAPLIWYCIVPNHLAAVPEVSAHVFFSPADNAIEQDDDGRKISRAELERLQDRRSRSPEIHHAAHSRYRRREAQAADRIGRHLSQCGGI